MRSLTGEAVFISCANMYALRLPTLQGFQLLANMQDGFGGMANEICAHVLHEQFPKKAIWFNGIAPPSLHALQVLISSF